MLQRGGLLMKTIALFAVALVVGCTCGETHFVPDASFDAPGLDVAIDAFTPPPFEPTLVWRAEGAGMCPDLMTPVWDPPAEPPIARGERRWGSGGTSPVSYVAGTLLADGTSFWARDFSREQSLDYLTGAYGGTTLYVGTPIVPETIDTEFRYALPRMTLGRNTIVIRDLWSLRFMRFGAGGSALRSWTFPVLDDLFAAQRALPLPDMRFGGPEQTMPAWNPVTGQIAFTVGLENSILAVQCAGDDLGQFILDIGPRNTLSAGRNPYTQVYYRENGELLVLRNERLFVISPTGEVLRSHDTLAGARAHAYDAECGLLFSIANQWRWQNVDTQLLGPPFQARGDAFATAGTQACGIIQSTRAGVFVSHPGAEDRQIGLPNTGRLAVPGGFALLEPAPSPRISIVDSAGNETDMFLAPERRLGRLLTPDGNVIYPGTRWYLGLPAGPQLSLDSGLNWAHTNSPLPE